ncbi:MAG: hypothetical protein LAO56_04505 [Acidobacteriia bacterium]|nr:hypothetical protein [Terriglobia bacterium]
MLYFPLPVFVGVTVWIAGWHILLNFAAVIGLLFYVYAVIRILKTWRYRDRMNVAIWFVVLGLLGGMCIGLLLMK